ncbi:HAD family hydrolase [Peptacetobacter hominis]|uniref:HAD family hydrolase n=1 Tax=Peptacetobacter hominis TaxID=2743610 RepID=A0A544QV13_9FIRM|nr:HAD family hydrolase [Peptacetobacter hominis]TQQ84539.1 HAD family hydrolase [Peptacetobacter hominis]
MKKLAFFDVDGTLIDCSNGKMGMSERVKSAIKNFQKRGNKAMVSTGRPFAFLTKELMEFGFDGFILGNGAQVTEGEKRVHFNAMDKDFVKFVVENCDRIGIEYCLQGEKYSYSKKFFNELISYYAEYEISTDYFIFDFNLDDIEVFKIEMLPVSKKGDMFCRKLDELEDYNCFKNYPARAYELYPVSNSKGKAVSIAAEYMGVDIENTYAFGDGRNDIEMIEMSGHGIAMGNACEELKSVAKEMTETVENDGIAAYLEKLV